MRQAHSAHEPHISRNVVSLPNAQPTDLTACSKLQSTSFDPIDRDAVLHWLSENVPESRLEHILRVEAMAIDLAEQHQLDVVKAAQAGLMHDLAKYFKPARLIDMAQAEGLALDPVDEMNPHLLHADIGAIVARDQFGVSDEQVLNAIRNHTLGQPGMDDLSCVVFLADGLEPGRGNTPELEQLRQHSFENLSEAVWKTCDYTLHYLLEHHQLVHPRAIATRNWFLQTTRRRHAAGSVRPTSA
ncbi:MAG TPA: bis(5'-nucleosyl)-tetraphosphatase (symmetrical) YqeK [Leptolyngbyaceae cyanobacterium M33_DOE_097]|uniref:bis(5'-nucleosyl)-tetraphosphatase (symmetrical) n=1 Tax=Oscillatoriales cyanobacterium SpSt-418 TaxID=2282169 RepID=A0A7C3KCU1_9CYAN|nr:bis(5'-nucleosyl)-tetraphosphatase (symmetrical) YqeK [Leptolyngbyaceae cyanobacterium M33_DOE_097]